MEGRMGTIDRATLAAWRGANVALWSLAALAGAAVLRLGAESFASLFGFGFGDARTSLEEAAYLIGVCIVGHTTCGAFIGTLAGARVATRPVVTASAAAALGAALLIFGFEPWALCAECLRGWTFAVAFSSLVAIPAAGVAARLVSKNRPRALR